MSSRRDTNTSKLSPFQVTVVEIAQLLEAKEQLHESDSAQTGVWRKWVQQCRSAGCDFLLSQFEVSQKAQPCFRQAFGFALRFSLRFCRFCRFAVARRHGLRSSRPWSERATFCLAPSERAEAAEAEDGRHLCFISRTNRAWPCSLQINNIMCSFVWICFTRCQDIQCVKLHAVGMYLCRMYVCMCVCVRAAGILLTILVTRMDSYVCIYIYICVYIYSIYCFSVDMLHTHNRRMCWIF